MKLSPILLAACTLLAACASPGSDAPTTIRVRKLVAPSAEPSPPLPTAPPAEPRPRSRPTSLAPSTAPPSLPVSLGVETTRIRLRVHGEESLRKVGALIQTLSGIPVVVHPAAENAAIDLGVVFDLDLEHPLSVANVLDLVCERAGGDVTWVVRHDVVLVTTKEKARQGRLSLATYDVRSLTVAQTDFLAPRIDRIRLLDDLEDEDGGGPFGGVGESVRSIEEDAVVALIQEHVAPGTWEDEGVSIQVEGGMVFVVHTPEVQAEVRRFLWRLGAF